MTVNLNSYPIVTINSREEIPCVSKRDISDIFPLFYDVESNLVLVGIIDKPSNFTNNGPMDIYCLLSITLFFLVVRTWWDLMGSYVYIYLLKTGLGILDF